MTQSEENKTQKSIRSVKLLLDFCWYGAIVLIILISLDIAYTELELNKGIAFHYTTTSNITYAGDNPAILDAAAQCTDIRINGFDSIRLVSHRPDWKMYTHALKAVVPLFFLLIVYLLRQFFKTMVAGHPFSDENFKRIRWIGILLTFFGPAYGLMELAVSEILMDDIACLLPDAEVSTYWDIRLLLMGSGMVITIVSEIFRVGARLQRDADLTI